MFTAYCLPAYPRTYPPNFLSLRCSLAHTFGRIEISLVHKVCLCSLETQTTLSSSLPDIAILRHAFRAAFNINPHSDTGSSMCFTCRPNMRAHIRTRLHITSDYTGCCVSRSKHRARLLFIIVAVWHSSGLRPGVKWFTHSPMVPLRLWPSNLFFILCIYDFNQLLTRSLSISIVSQGDHST